MSDGIVSLPATSSTIGEAIATRSAQEVQAAMIIAKRFPRDETASIERILRACRRKGLAETAQYRYPRGGTAVSGPSIRLAEAMAQGWGNIDYGVIELENDARQASLLAYAWDLETNARSTKVFSVKHQRRAGKEIKALDDPRDVYENEANFAARRMRACILAIIPRDVQDLAIDECNKTLVGGSKEPLIDRVRKMIHAFAELGVTKEMVETRLGHHVDACAEQDLVTLRGIYSSIRDGMSKVDQWFAKPASAADEKKQASAESFSEPTKAEPKPKVEAEPERVPDEKLNEWDDRLKKAKTKAAVLKIHAEIDGWPKIDSGLRDALLEACGSRIEEMEK